METETPDFNRLARESIYSVDEWRLAWESLEDPRCWSAVVTLARTNACAPLVAAFVVAGSARPHWTPHEIGLDTVTYAPWLGN